MDDIIDRACEVDRAREAILNTFYFFQSKICILWGTKSTRNDGYFSLVSMVGKTEISAHGSNSECNSDINGDHSPYIQFCKCIIFKGVHKKGG